MIGRSNAQAKVPLSLPLLLLCTAHGCFRGSSMGLWGFRGAQLSKKKSLHAGRGGSGSESVVDQCLPYKSDDGFGRGAGGVAGADGAGVAGVAGATGNDDTGAADGATTVFAGSMSVDPTGISTMLLLKLARTFWPSIAMRRKRVPGFSVTLPNCN